MTGMTVPSSLLLIISATTAVITILPRQNWFNDKTYDRTKLYFSDNSVKRPSNTLWAYDSGGSQVLCALIERLTGKTMLEYLTEKIFAKTGFFKTARVLKTPNGDSWGDSALICTQRDVASFAQLLLDGGVWQGERLINEDLVKKATSSIVDNNIDSFASPFRFGYGYQIWKTERDDFAFVGMGDQLTIVVPQKDLVFSICSDNQGNPNVRELIFDYFFDIIIDDMLDVPIANDETTYKDLQIYLSKKELFHLDNSVDFDKESVNNVKYILSDNPMGIKWFKFNFDLGEFLYENAQGQKVIGFGIDKNVFSNFPEYGYAKDYGTQVTTDGFTYKCATSIKFADSNKIIMCVQIIDDYFGNMSALFAFKGDEVVLNMSKTAEDFLQTYQGTALGRKEKN